MLRVPIALQLYSIRDACAADLPGTLRQVAGMGYEGVEFAGYHGQDAIALRRLLADSGLRAAGAHVPVESLLGAKLEGTAEFHRELENRLLIVPGLPESWRNSADAWRRSAEAFEAIADRLAPYGLSAGYHNHSLEFTPIAGEIPFEIFFDQTPQGVIMQVDTGNARHAGADAVPYIRRYPGRARSVHLKEFSADPARSIIGEGEIAWPEVFAACESVGATEWYIVEQEAYPQPPLDCVRRCLENLRRMGK